VSVCTARCRRCSLSLSLPLTGGLSGRGRRRQDVYHLFPKAGKCAQAFRRWVHFHENSIHAHAHTHMWSHRHAKGRLGHFCRCIEENAGCGLGVELQRRQIICSHTCREKFGSGKFLASSVCVDTLPSVSTCLSPSSFLHVYPCRFLYLCVHVFLSLFCLCFSVVSPANFYRAHQCGTKVLGARRAGDCHQV
jgi:hypothetical protein